jgi:hypothetical protein
MEDLRWQSVSVGEVLALPICHLPFAMQAGIVQRPATTSAASRAKVSE